MPQASLGRPNDDTPGPHRRVALAGPVHREGASPPTQARLAAGGGGRERAPPPQGMSSGQSRPYAHPPARTTPHGPGTEPGPPHVPRRPPAARDGIPACLLTASGPRPLPITRTRRSRCSQELAKLRRSPGDRHLDPPVLIRLLVSHVRQPERGGAGNPGRAWWGRRRDRPHRTLLEPAVTAGQPSDSRHGGGRHGSARQSPRQSPLPRVRTIQIRIPPLAQDDDDLPLIAVDTLSSCFRACLSLAWSMV